MVHVQHEGIDEQPLVPRSAVKMMPGWTIVGEEPEAAPAPLAALVAGGPVDTDAKAPAADEGYVAPPPKQPESEPAKPTRSRERKS